MDAEERFATVVEALTGVPGVEASDGSGRRAFGSEALKVNGAIFAMVTNGHLVVKLPQDRVGALIGEGSGAPFGLGTRRPIRSGSA